MNYTLSSTNWEAESHTKFASSGSYVIPLSVIYFSKNHTFYMLIHTLQKATVSSALRT